MPRVLAAIAASLLVQVVAAQVCPPQGTDPFTVVGATVLPSGASTWWIRAD